jgi:hypothetical protein
MLLSLRPWRVAARPVILENRGAKSHFCDSFVVTACRNRAFIVCLSTGMSDSNVYTNETGKRQMILMIMMMTLRNKRKILKRNSRIHKL